VKDKNKEKTQFVIHTGFQTCENVCKYTHRPYFLEHIDCLKAVVPKAICHAISTVKARTMTSQAIAYLSSVLLWAYVSKTAYGTQLQYFNMSVRQTKYVVLQ
jgi:hypothetical protein